MLKVPLTRWREGKLVIDVKPLLVIMSDRAVVSCWKPESEVINGWNCARTTRQEGATR
jgi:hypothetical protein